MNKFSSIILGLGLLTTVNAFASIPLGSTVLSHANQSYAIDVSKSLNSKFTYDITCHLEGQPSSDAVLRFDDAYFQSSGPLKYDGSALITRQQKITEGNHKVVYEQYISGSFGGTPTVTLSYVIGTSPVNVTCSAYPSVGVK